MNYPDLSRQIQEHQLAYFRLHKNRYYVYHDLDHTQGVVKAAMQIANHYQLNEKDFFIVTTAAWFHDAGYFEDDLHHEKRGAELAAAYLTRLGVDEDTIQKIQQCIVATTLPQSPKTKLEEIVCDSDLFHLGTDDFRERNKLMRKEAENRRDQPISKDAWRKSTIRLFMTHHYFTDYCQLLLGHKKKENLEKLQQKVAEKDKRSPGANSPVIPITAKQPLPAKHRSALPALPVQPLTSFGAGKTGLPPAGPHDTIKKKADKNNLPGRGVETMFRITSHNNQRLSDMADNKAQIMITVNSIILSAILSLLLRRLAEYSYLAWPTYLLLAVSVLTIIFSILATRPSVQRGVFTQRDIDQQKVNLLFFGNFYKMNLADYSSGMRQVMNDSDFLYNTLVRDVYGQGVVLGRKYKLMRISYNIFMYGLVVSVLAFVLASILEGA